MMEYIVTGQEYNSMPNLDDNDYSEIKILYKGTDLSEAVGYMDSRDYQNVTLFKQV